MTQPTDWEALMEETRAKATAAARHSEGIVGGVAQMLSAQPALLRQLDGIAKRLDEIASRLGSLEAPQSRERCPTETTQRNDPRSPSARLPWALAGLVAGVVLSVAYSWSW